MRGLQSYKLTSKKNPLFLQHHDRKSATKRQREKAESFAAVGHLDACANVQMATLDGGDHKSPLRYSPICSAASSLRTACFRQRYERTTLARHRHRTSDAHLKRSSFDARQLLFLCTFFG